MHINRRRQGIAVRSGKRDPRRTASEVTAFPSRATMTKFLSEIAWETEVWVAEART
jgi:hypothetical protein